MRELPQLSEPATSGDHLPSARELGLFSSDEWRKCTAETIEIRKMVYRY
jgi:hypothetical protein